MRNRAASRGVGVGARKATPSSCDSKSNDPRTPQHTRQSSGSQIRFPVTPNPKRPYPDESPDRWLGSEEACAHLGCCTRSLMRAIAAGRLKAFRLGRSLKFRRVDLDRLLEPVNAGMADDISIGDFIKQQQEGTP